MTDIEQKTRLREMFVREVARIFGEVGTHARINYTSPQVDTQWFKQQADRISWCETQINQLDAEIEKARVKA